MTTDSENISPTQEDKNAKKKFKAWVHIKVTINESHCRMYYKFQ